MSDDDDDDEIWISNTSTHECHLHHNGILRYLHLNSLPYLS